MVEEVENQHYLSDDDFKMLKEALSLSERYVIERYYLDQAPFRDIVKECRCKPAVIYQVIDRSLTLLERIRRRRGSNER